MGNDLLEQLSRLNPVDERDLPDGHSPQAETLLAEVLAESFEDPAPATPLRRRPWLLVPAAALLLGAGWLLTQPTPNPQEINCYRTASVHADRAAFHMDAEEWDPAGTCAAAWQEGELWPDGVPDSLAECVTDVGTVAVVPGPDGDACQALGWSELDAEGSPLEVVALHRTIAEHYRQVSCVPLDEAEALARDALEGSGLEGWQVERAATVAEDTPCVSMTVEGPGRTVLIVPHDASGD